MVRLRIQYQKVGRIRYTSHRDLVRIFQRCFSVGRIPVCYSRGFHPHPRISLGPPLKTGWEGLGEYMDIFMEAESSGVGERMNHSLPEGLRVTQTAPVDEGVPKLTGDIHAARLAVEMVDEDVLRRLGSVHQSGPLKNDIGFEGNTGELSGNGLIGPLEKAIRERFGNTDGSTDVLAPTLLELSAHRGGGSVVVEYTCTMPSGKSLTPGNLLSPFLGSLEEFAVPPKVVRKALYVKRNGALLSPISKGVIKKSS